ncbi:MAG: hypothetical protein ACFB0Z_06910 [Candidatus Phaeomarinobacter sp.]
MRDFENAFPDASGSLEAKALEDAADQLEARARELRMKAHTKRTASDRTRAWARNKKQIAKHVKKLIRDGMADDMAVSKTALAFGCPPETVRFMLTQASKDRTYAARDQRYTEVMERTARGQTCKQIGEAMDLHPKSVSRIRAAMRARWRRQGRPLSRGPSDGETGPLAWTWELAGD